MFTTIKIENLNKNTQQIKKSIKLIPLTNTITIVIISNSYIILINW